MAKLFESTFGKEWEFYERYYDTELEKSVQKRIDLPYEWYVPSSTGLYSYILDETVRLEKKQGNSKNAKGNYGILDPMYRNIRDNYWGTSDDNPNGYNKEPRIWDIDIETRVGKSYKNEVNGDKILKVRKKYKK